MLTVLCWLWAQPGGRTTYTALHVNIWTDMVRRHLSIPHRLACVTDTPEGIDPSVAIIAPPGDFEDARIPTWSSEKPQCLRRLALFRPDAAKMFGERFVSMDLDCVIGDSLDPLFDTDADFKMYRGTPSNFRPYNGSMLLMTAGARPEVYERFSQDEARIAGERYIGSDQAWISHVLGSDETTWGPEDGVLWYGGLQTARLAKSRRIMFFPGTPKPWEIAGVPGGDPWIAEHYSRSAGSGRCLILGHAPSVWDEASLALEAGAFDAVIASPEAAAHLSPDVILATAGSDSEAERLARLAGFGDLVFCGRADLSAAA